MLSIGVITAILFECAAKLIRSYLTDVAGKKADLIISSALLRRVMAVKMSDRPASSGSYASNLREYESVREFMTSATLLALLICLLFCFSSVLSGSWEAGLRLYLLRWSRWLFWQEYYCSDRFPVILMPPCGNHRSVRDYLWRLWTE